MTRKANVSVMVRKYQAGVEDAHGNVVPGYGDPEERLVYKCAPTLDPESFQVARDDEGGVRWDIYAPAGTDIEAKDRVEYAGQLLDVDGPPMVWETVGQVHNLVWKGAIDG